MTVPSISDEKLAGARDFFEWFLAYQEAGFTEEQALAILVKPAVSITSAQYPPEVMEFWERQNALATKLMVEMDE